jgi:hypothetical protein
VLWNPTYQPKLRPVEAIPTGDVNGLAVALRDRSGLSPVVLTVSRGALGLLSLLDGARTCERIRLEFEALFAQRLSIETLLSVLEQLERAYLLEGPTFEAYYQERLRGYRERGVREMSHAGQLGLADASGGVFAAMLDGVQPPPLAGRIAGLIAPHLDYPRGRPCYAAAYAALARRAKPARVVVLGTNHFGRSTAVVGTANAFATPLGTTQTDVAFLRRMEERCGPLRGFELDHAREHSVELQVAWLQYLFGAEAFQLVAFLCPDPCGPTATAPGDGQGVDLRLFAEALRDLLVEDLDDTLLVAGADFSHVGAAFGDERRLDEPFLGSVAEIDARALARLEEGDAEGFRATIAANQNATRICSAGCMFTLAAALPTARVTRLGYHQAVHEPSQTCVTCAAAAYTIDERGGGT